MKETSYERVYRRYVFNQKELKETLGMKGIINNIGVEQGLSPQEEKEGKSTDTNLFFIETEERREND